MRGVRVVVSTGLDKKGLNQAEAAFKGLGKSILKQTIGITSAGVALAKFTSLLKESVAAAIADQKSQEMLNLALKRSGWGVLTEEVTKFVDAAQMATGISDNELRSSMVSLTNATGDAAAAQHLLTLAMDVSAGTGKDLGTTVDALAKLMTGQRKGLAKLGTGLDIATIKTAKFDDLLVMLETKFKGSSATAAETFSGKMDRLREAIGEGKETVGYALIDVFAQLAGNGDINTATSNIKKFSAAVGDFIRQVGGVNEPSNAFAGYIHDFAKGIVDDVKLIGKAIGTGSNLPGSPLALLGNLNKIANPPKSAAEIKQAAQWAAFTTARQERYDRWKAGEAARRAAELERRAKLAAALAAAKARAAAAQKAKQAELQKAANELSKQFDLERIGLAAALAKSQDESTRNRLTALMQLNDLQYAENSSLTEMQKLLDEINKLQAQLNARTLEGATNVSKIYEQFRLAANEATRLQSLYANSTPGSAAAFRIGETLANAGIASPSAAPAAAVSSSSGGAGTWTLPSPGGNTNVTVNVTGSLVAQADLEAALAGAVNSSARAGLSYNQVFSRL